MIYSTGRTGLGLHPGENLKGSGLRVEFSTMNHTDSCG